jgi:hypothetical protein
VSELFAETLMKEFEVMAKQFPYVIVPDVSISQLRRQQPLLLLSVLATSAWRNRPLQISLERHYLKDICERMVLKEDYSLDLLQSLLVHLAWFVGPNRSAGHNT